MTQPLTPRHACRAWLALVALGFATTATAAAKRPLRVDDLFTLRDVADPRLSPDGTQVVFTVRSLDLKQDKRDTDIYAVSVEGGEAQRLTARAEAETTPRFSPDGKYLAFLSGREGKGGEGRGKETQVYLLPRAGGEAVKLTDFKGGVSDLAWSPDSKRLALIVSDPDPDEIDEEAKAADDARKTPKPVVLTRLQFKRDGTGFLRELRNQVHVFDVEKKTGFQLTTGRFDHAEPVWSPDGQWIAFSSNRTEDADANRNTDVYVVAPRPHAQPRQLTTAPTSANQPAFSPDGKLIVYVEGGNPADMYYEVSHLSVVPVAGGENRFLTKELDRNPQRPQFSSDGRHVVFLLEDRLSVHLARIPAAGGAVERLVRGDRVLSALEVGKKGELVVLESQSDHPAEVSLVQAGGALKRLSHINDAALEGIALGKVTQHEAKSADGTVVDFFLTHPPDAGTGNLPALLRIHGGPVSQYQHEFSFEWQLFAANGYLVVAANPRGSSGRGLAFSRAIWADWGGKDFQDVMAAVDAAIAMGKADGDRLGVGGWSYGGILTDWTIHQTHRFKAAISGAGIANVMGAYGTDHYQWEYEVELGFPWKNTAGWLAMSKPFLEADKIKTPTLFLCGEIDWNVPLIHSEQMFQALRRLGVPTRLVVYPVESHGIRVPTYQKDRYERYLAWYDKYMKPAPAAGAAAPLPEATSFLGQPLLSPSLSDEERKTLDANLAKALDAFGLDPDSTDKLIWVGRRLGYLGRYRDATELFSRGVVRLPEDVRLLRFRGHRYITLRQPDKAIADLAKADAIIRSKGLKDETEPDGVPGPPGSTPSTLFFNVYYHLGLAHFVKGDYAAAETAYRECLRHSQPSLDSVVATSRWLYATLRHLGKAKEAAELLASLPKDLTSPSGYKDLLLLFRGEKSADEVLRGATSGIDHPTLTYGVADFLLVNGQKERALGLMREVVRSEQWPAFGFVAAEAELSRNR